MTTFIKMKFNKSDDLTNIDNIEKQQILQNSQNLLKFMEKRQLFYVKNVCKYVKNQQV